MPEPTLFRYAFSADTEIFSGFWLCAPSKVIRSCGVSEEDVMFKWMLAFTVVATGAAAHGQSVAPGRPSQSAVAAAADLQMRSNLYFPEERKECLVRKSINRRECHTRREWQALAAKMERDEASMGK